MANILLFGGGLQSLSIARGLKEDGHTVFNMAEKASVGRFSRFVDHFDAIDMKLLEWRELLRFLIANEIGLVIPMEDEYAEWLSANKSDLEKNADVKLAVEREDLFARVINKRDLLGFCKENDIPHPCTVPLTVDNYHLIQFPALIKPDVSNGSRGICRVDSIDDLHSKAPEALEKYGSCTVQEYIEQSHYYNVMLYRYGDGSWGQHVVTKITRYYPVKGGSSSFCTTVANEEILKPCKKLLERLDWKGFADFDVLEKGTGDYRIIEINPRVPASVHAAYISGVNYGKMIADDLLYNKKTTACYTPGMQLRFLGLDIAWFLASPARFKCTPSWFRFIGRRLHYQEGGIKDFMAMAYSIWLGVKKELSPSFRKAKSGMN